MTAVARKMPDPCPYKAAKHQIPDEDTGEGDHDWWQQGGLDMIWCRVCGADYNDEGRMHVMFAPRANPTQFSSKGLFATEIQP